MIPGEFTYYAPTTLHEAVALLGEHGDGAKLLAGGQSLIPAMCFRLAVPETLIDINGIQDLDYVRVVADPLVRNSRHGGRQEGFWERHGLQCGFCTLV